MAGGMEIVWLCCKYLISELQYTDSAYKIVIIN